MIFIVFLKNLVRIKSEYTPNNLFLKSFHIRPVSFFVLRAGRWTEVMLIQLFSGPNHYFAKKSGFTTLMYFKGPFSNTIVHVVLPSEGK